MGTARLRIGKQADGTYGMRSTLPGFDVRYDDASDVTKFSFNSEWTDIVRVHDYGYADAPAPVPSWPGPVPGAIDDASNSFRFTNNNDWLIPHAHSLGYVPFVEARVISGSTIYDDYRKFSKISGTGTGDWEFNGERAWAFIDTVKLNTWSHTTYDSGAGTYNYFGCRVGFIIYAVSVSV